MEPLILLKVQCRNLAQALAKEYAQDNIHVAHVIVDGPLDGERLELNS